MPRRAAPSASRSSRSGTASGASSVALRLHGHARRSRRRSRCAARTGLDIDLFEVSYFLSRETVVPRRGAAMAHWREALFAAMARNAGSVAEFFRLPDNCVVELGTRVQL